MKRSTITAHCLIRNEEKWIWYSINSIINYVDKIIIYDTGSTDNTVKIIKTFNSPKIIFKEKGIVDKKQFTGLRQEMLKMTTTDWFMILDGDEIWPRDTIEELIYSIIHASKTKKVVSVGQWTCLGDVFHYSKALADMRMPQTPKNLKGYRLIRVVRKNPDLHCVGEYGYESYADKQGNISLWKKKQIIFLKNKYWHMTFLPRSSSTKKDREVMMRTNKTLYYLGAHFSDDILYPEVFYKIRPDYIPSPWKKFTLIVKITGYYYRFLNILNRLAILFI